MKRSVQLPAKWLEEFAKVTPDEAAIRKQCKERQLSEKTILDQLNRLRKLGILAAPVSSEPPIAPYQVRAVPKNVQIKGRTASGS